MCAGFFQAVDGSSTVREYHECGRNYQALSFPKIPSGLDSHRKAESSHH